MSLDTQIKALLESDEPITEDELVEETIEEIADEDQAEISDEVDEESDETSDDSDAEFDDELNEEFEELYELNKGDYAKIAYRVTDPEYEGRLSHAHVVSRARKEHGDKFADQIADPKEKMHYGRLRQVGYDKLGERKPTRVTKGGKANKQDVAALKSRIKSDIKEDAEDADSTKEHIDALLNGEELSEEFRTKATTIFEAAVADGVKKQVAQLEEQYNEMLNDAIISVQEELVDKIDGYLGTIVEEWVTENQLAIERGVKADLVEEFIDGLKKLFNDHYVDIPEEKADILDEQIERLESAESELAEAAQKVAELEEEVVELRKLRNIEMVGEELTDSQFEKFLSLCENVDFESEESFVNKIKTIKESYFPSKATVNESVALNMDTPLLVDEKTSETINAYVKALSSPLTFKK